MSIVEIVSKSGRLSKENSWEPTNCKWKRRRKKVLWIIDCVNSEDVVGSVLSLLLL